MKIPIIIDTDPGIDDAVAIALALYSEKVDVKLITTVAGNVAIEKVTQNTLKLLKFYNKRIPVAQGAGEPLIEPFSDASNIHGVTGLEGYDFPNPDLNLLMKEHAVDAIYKALCDSKDLLTIVPIGPLTNIALLLKKYPDSRQKIKDIVLMGGSYTRGNKGVMSEFNIATDPEAADIVFNSGIKITMVGLEIGNSALIFPKESQQIKSMNKVGDMFYSLFKKYRSGSFENGLRIYDATAVAYLSEPSLFETQETFVAVELNGKYTRGATIVDLDNRLNQLNNCTVCLSIDAERFRRWMLESIQNIKI